MVIKLLGPIFSQELGRQFERVEVSHWKKGILNALRTVASVLGNLNFTST